MSSPKSKRSARLSGIQKKIIMKNLLKQFRSEQSGFTLIEILVATTVFVLGSMMFMGIFATISGTTLRVEGNRLAQQDVRYATELIAREVRAGYNFEVDDQGDELRYETKDGDYRIYTEEIDKAESDEDFPVYTLYKEQDGVGLPSQLISDEVFLKDLNFAVIQPANEYPIVEISMEVFRKGFKKVQDATTITTRVTSRVRGEN